MKDGEAFLIRPFPEWESQVEAAFTLRSGEGRADPGPGWGPYADLNLGYRCGDDPLRVDANWSKVLGAAGLTGKTLVMPRMVHGDAMAEADVLPPAPPVPQETRPGRIEPEGADALYSRSPDRILAVTMADCLAVLLFDPASGTVGAIHAGWRGTRLGILEKSLRTLLGKGIIKPATTMLAFSPCLRPASLEVGTETAALLDPEFLIRSGGRFFFDMAGCNRSQALACGIRPERIRDVGGCSLGEPSRFFSYRRDGRASGRMAALISLRGP